MHLFQTTTLLYLFLHVLAFLCCFISIMGIPGNPDEKDKRTALLFKTWGILLLIAWRGLPALAIVSLLAFFFHYDLLGKVASCLSLLIGLGLFLNIVLYYSLLHSKK